MKQVITEAAGKKEFPQTSCDNKCLGCVYVQRESKSSDFMGVSGAHMYLCMSMHFIIIITLYNSNKVKECKIPCCIPYFVLYVFSFHIFDGTALVFLCLDFLIFLHNMHTSQLFNCKAYIGRSDINLYVPFVRRLPNHCW